MRTSTTQKRIKHRTSKFHRGCVSENLDKNLDDAGHLNSDRFAAPGGGGLLALAKELPERCREVIRRQGERIPK
jgi:uncharacterized protein (UPF0303 family)